MTIDPAIFRALVAQGATPEMLLAVIEADAAASEERNAKKRADNAERQARFRAKNQPKRNASNALQSVTERDGETLPPNDIYSNPPEPSSANADALPFSNRVVSAWNEAATAGLTAAKGLDTTRKAHLRSRVKDHGEAAVLEAIRNLAASPFHCGKNDRGWKANIGWFLKPEGFLKALEMGRTGDAKPVAPVEDAAAYRASLADKPWMRGREGELAQPRNPTHARRGPVPVGDLVSRIAGHAA